MDSKRYIIPTCNVDEFIRRIDKLNKCISKMRLKAPEADIQPIKCIPLSAVIHQSKKSAFGNDITTNAVEYEITGSAPKLKGYEFLTQVTHNRLPTGEYQNSLIESFITQEVPDILTCAPICQHCNLNRRRNVTYFLRKESDNSIIQVGSACLQDFFGYASPHVIAKVMEKLDKELSKIDKNFHIRNTEILLDDAAPILGYLMSINFQEGVKQALLKACVNQNSELINTILALDEQTIAGYSLYINSVLIWARDLTTGLHQVFNQNMKQLSARILSTGVISQYDLGLFCYMPIVYERQKKEQARLEALRLKQPDKIQTFIKYTPASKHRLALTCTDISTINSDFGAVIRYKFVDNENLIYTWFSNSQRAKIWLAGDTRDVEIQVKNYSDHPQYGINILLKTVKV